MSECSSIWRRVFWLRRKWRSVSKVNKKKSFEFDSAFNFFKNDQNLDSIDIDRNRENADTIRELKIDVSFLWRRWSWFVDLVADIGRKKLLMFVDFSLKVDSMFWNDSTWNAKLEIDRRKIRFVSFCLIVIFFMISCVSNEWKFDFRLMISSSVVIVLGIEKQ